MKKKAIIIISILLAVLALGVGLALFLTNGFTVGRITDKVYNVQNVYDEIWNLLKQEEYGKKTVLTDLDPTASKVYELGVFDYLRIPKCNATLMNRTGTLWISINTGEFVTEDTTGRICEKYVVYEYDCHAKTLKITGTDNEDYLIDHFLTDYFKRQESDKSQTEYSIGKFGDYSTEIVNLGDYYPLLDPIKQ